MNFIPLLKNLKLDTKAIFVNIRTPQTASQKFGNDITKINMKSG